MTADEWDKQDEVYRLFKELKAQKLLGTRKSRLAGCAFFRLLWDRITVEQVKYIVEQAEGRASGTVSQRELANLPKPHITEQSGLANAIGFRVALDELMAERVNAEDVSTHLHMATYDQKVGYSNAHPGHATVIREIFGNPFRPVTFDPKWRTEAAVGVAAKMYDDRDFRAMPILADALEEAGCDNAEVLSHCREPGVHVRGCWVVDLVLGKA